MSEYSFSDSQRLAVWTVHDEKCWLCDVPIPLNTAEVDHIIPEQLLSDPDELNETIWLFDLPSDFGLDDYENWLPCCRRCNSKKANHVFRPTPLIQLWLEKAAAKKAACQAAVQELRSDMSFSGSLKVMQAAEQERLPKECVERLALFLRTHNREALQGQEIMLNSSNSVTLTEGSTKFQYKDHSTGITTFEHKDHSTGRVTVTTTAASNT